MPIITQPTLQSSSHPQSGGLFDRGALIITKTLRRAAAAGGNVWYDIQSELTADTQAGVTTTSMNWASITLGQAGSVTKLRLYHKHRYGDVDLKMALYSNADSLLANGVRSLVGGDATDQWLEVTMDTPYSASATTYKIAWQASNNNLDGFYLASAGSLSAGTNDYASFPPATLPSEIGPFAQNWCVGVFVA